MLSQACTCATNLDTSSGGDTSAAIGWKVLLADLVVYARSARSPHRSYNVITCLKFLNIFADFNHTAEIFMASHKVVEALRSNAVFAIINFAVGSARTDSEHFDKDAATVLYIV